MRRAHIVLLACLLFACKAERSPNEIVVVVDSDLRIGTDLKTIAVEIDDRSLDGGALITYRFELAPTPPAGESVPVGQYTLPLSFVLAPSLQNSTRDFRLVVTGLDLGENIAVEQQVISSFRPEYSGRLNVFLAQRCVKNLCYVDGQRSAETCNATTGLCEDTPVEVAEKVNSGNSLAGYQRNDAAVAAADSGSVTDAAAVDAGVAPVSDSGALAATDGGNDAGSLADASVPPMQTVDVMDHMIAASGFQARAAASLTGRGAVVYQTVVAGSDPANMLYESFVALYEPATGWATPMSLSGTRPADESDEIPHAIFDAQGNLTVTWFRGDAVIARRNNAATLAWDNEVTIRTGDANGDHNLAVDPAGNVMVVMLCYDGNFNTARWEVQKKAWNTVLGYVNDTSSQNGDTPIIASDPSGNITAVWPTNAKVFGNRFDATSARWGTPVVIRSSTAAGFNTGYAHLGVRNDGLAFAAWFETDDDSGYEVGANAWDPMLGGWRVNMVGAPVQRIGDGVLSALTSDPDGLFVAFWDGRIRTYDGNNTTGFAAALAVGRDGSVNLADQFTVEMGVDARGTRIAAWAQNVATGVDVAWSWAARPSSGSESWADLALLGVTLPPADNSVLVNAGYPKLSVGSPGTALVTWNQALSNAANPGTSVHARWVTFGTP